MSCAVNTTNLVNVGCPTMSGTDIPRQLSDGGRYDPILRLAQVQIQPPRNPNKPLTPFSIVDILNSGADEMHNIRRKHQRHSHHYRQQQQQLQLQHQQQEPTSIKRPWDDGSCKSAGFSTDFDDDDDYDDDDDVDDRDDEEIDVVDEVNAKKGLGGCKAVCPLDALLKMASKAFDSRSAENLNDENDKLDQTMANGLSKSHNSKKRRKSRTAFTNKQIYELEKRFLYQKYLTPVDRDEIAQSLGLSKAQVITWFQNRRAKLKRDMEELKADVIAAKALGKEPTSALIGGIEELLNGTKDALKRKPQKQQQIPTTNIPNDAHSNDSNASSLPVSDNSRATSHDSSDMHQSCHSDGIGSARRDSVGPDIE